MVQGALLCALLLGGCSSVTDFRGLPLAEHMVYVSGVPPLRQDSHYACGASCLAAVAAYWGVELSVFRAKFPEMPRELNAAEMQSLAGAFGMQAFAYRGSEADLRENLKKNRPLIVMIPKPMAPAGLPGGVIGAGLRAVGEHLPHPAHWVIVLGLTDGGDLILHDPGGGPLLMKRNKFLHDWAAMDNAALLVAAR